MTCWWTQHFMVLSLPGTRLFSLGSWKTWIGPFSNDRTWTTEGTTEIVTSSWFTGSHAHLCLIRLTCVSVVPQVRTLRMHLFTLVELTCLSLLWVVMATAAALAFPFMLLLTIPVRMLLLPRLFSRRELQSVSPAFTVMSSWHHHNAGRRRTHLFQHVTLLKGTFPSCPPANQISEV